MPEPAEFRIQKHPLVDGTWQLVGPDGAVWCSGPEATKERVAQLLGITAGVIQLAGLASQWASELTPA